MATEKTATGAAMKDNAEAKQGRRTDGAAGNRLAKLIDKAIDKSSKSQREIADAVGFKNSNMITMIKQGHAKLPLDRVPAMARVLGIDAGPLFQLALEQFYSKEAIRELDRVIITPSDFERNLLNAVRAGDYEAALALLEELRSK